MSGADIGEAEGRTAVDGAVFERDGSGAPADERPERIIRWLRGPAPGPTLVAIGGLHGNEPAGVHALRRVTEAVADRESRMRGDFVALVGNRTALAQGRRFVDRDLNRAWTDQRLERLRATGRLGGRPEDREQAELLETLDRVVTEARGPVYVLDLHTTSGERGIFSTFGDSLPNRAFAEHVPVPMVLGLEELIEGTLLSFLGEHGLVSMAVETGQHDEPAAVDRAEAVVWIALEATALFDGLTLPEAARGRAYLEEEARGLPRAVEMRYRHPVTPDCSFRMMPGYRNFDRIRRGTVLARDCRGEVAVVEDSILLMPLYQEQGEDGFFLVRDFSPFWLRLSYLLRKIRADRVARWLPGVRVDPNDPDVLVIDRRVARLYALQFFHLLGFRSVKEEGAILVVRRRRFDETRFLRRGPPPRRLRDEDA